MTNLRRLAALLPFSVLFIAPSISRAQQHAPIADQTGEASNPVIALRSL
jgi:hypothetical protein